jgi:hypothetical protein
MLIHFLRSYSGRPALGKTITNDTELAHHTGDGEDVREGAVGGFGEAIGGVEVGFVWCIGSCGER